MEYENEVSRSNYDFCGYATKNDIKCSDGRTIRHGAFESCDGMVVPIVYQHNHSDLEKVLGHGLLENRDDGVYIYGLFNGTPLGEKAKECVRHGDIRGLSIYANQLKQKGGDVLHGMIREVSLVLAGANPGAYIEQVVSHGEELPDDMTAWYVEESPILLHSATSEKKSTGEQTCLEIFKGAMNKLTEDERTVIYSIIGFSDNSSKSEDSDKKENIEHSNIEGDSNMEHVFDAVQNDENALSHADKLAFFSDALEYAKKQKTTLRNALEDVCLAHSIDDIDMLFPDYHELNKTPEFIKNPDDWVSKVMGAVKHVPWSKIRTTFADITEGAARAKGYLTGNQKKEEFFGLARRQTGPTTVYKLQKLDRDNIIDITGFDVVAWIKGEMRTMLNEELARAILISDGRDSGDEEKINEDCIRPIWTDDDLFAIHKEITIATGSTDDQEAKAFIRAVVKAQDDYEGTGTPTLYCPKGMVTKCLLMEDTTGRVIYDTIEKLKTALRVAGIVEVFPMKDCSRIVDGDTRNLVGILVNLNDYNVGTDKGGQIESFEDFDLDFNKYTYLMETRCSGCLVKPHSAIVLETVYGLFVKMSAESGTTTVLGKLVSTVQENVVVNDNWIAGDLKYVSNWDAYESGAKGYFVVLKFEATSGATVKIKNTLTGREVALDSDMQAVIKVTNTKTQKLVVTCSKTGESDVVKTYSLGSLRCLEA